MIVGDGVGSSKDEERGRGIEILFFLAHRASGSTEGDLQRCEIGTKGFEKRRLASEKSTRCPRNQHDTLLATPSKPYSVGSDGGTEPWDDRSRGEENASALLGLNGFTGIVLDGFQSEVGGKGGGRRNRRGHWWSEKRMNSGVEI